MEFEGVGCGQGVHWSRRSLFSTRKAEACMFALLRAREFVGNSNVRWWFLQIAYLIEHGRSWRVNEAQPCDPAYTTKMTSSDPSQSCIAVSRVFVCVTYMLVCTYHELYICFYPTTLHTQFHISTFTRPVTQKSSLFLCITSICTAPYQ